MLSEAEVKANAMAELNLLASLMGSAAKETAKEADDEEEGQG